MRKDKWQGFLVFIFVVIVSMIVGVLVIDRMCHPKKEGFKIGISPIQKEIPKEVKVVMNRIKEKNVAIKNIMDEISTTNAPQEIKNTAFASMNVLYMKALREGMDNGRDAYLDGKIGEEKLLNQMEKAEKLMDEALEKAKKTLQEIKELKPAPKKGGFKLIFNKEAQLCHDYQYQQKALYRF